MILSNIETCSIALRVALFLKTKVYSDVTVKSIKTYPSQLALVDEHLKKKWSNYLNIDK